VEVDRAQAQQLVGNGSAEFYSGEPLIEPAPYEEQPEMVTASVEPPETEMRPPARRRRGY
jgi:hypothetical protein